MTCDTAAFHALYLERIARHTWRAPSAGAFQAAVRHVDASEEDHAAVTSDSTHALHVS